MKVDVGGAKKQLSKLLHRAQDGEEVIITKTGEPIAQLLAIESTSSRKSPRPIGTGKGQFVVPDDFNDPLPEFEKDFYGA
jgi:prevent-host-death family protein